MRTPVIIPQKYHVYEKDHRFIRSKDVWFRANWRETLVNGVMHKNEKLYENFAPVKYPVTEEYLSSHGFESVAF